MKWRIIIMTYRPNAKRKKTKIHKFRCTAPGRIYAQEWAARQKADLCQHGVCGHVASVTLSH